MKDDLPVEEEKARQTVPAYQPELLFQAFFHRFRHGAVAPERRLEAEAFQVALGGVPFGDGRLGEVIAQICAEVEGTLLRYTEGVGNGLGIVLEDVIHLDLGLQVQMVIGPDKGEGLVDGAVSLGRHQRLLELVPPWDVIVHVVGGHDRRPHVLGQPGKLPVACGVPLQEVLLELHVYVLRAVPLHVVLQQLPGLLATALQRQPGEASVPSAGEQDHAFRMGGKVRRVEPWLPAVDGVGQGEQSGYVGVPLARPGQKDQAGAVVEGQLPSGNGLDAQAAR